MKKETRDGLKKQFKEDMKEEETPSLKEIQELVEEVKKIEDWEKDVNMVLVSGQKKFLKQKAQKYKEIISKGCGEEFFRDGSTWNCGKRLHNGNVFEFCPSCKEKLKLLNEVLIPKKIKQPLGFPSNLTKVCAGDENG